MWFLLPIFSVRDTITVIFYFYNYELFMYRLSLYSKLPFFVMSICLLHCLWMSAGESTVQQQNPAYCEGQQCWQRLPCAQHSGITGINCFTRYYMKEWRKKDRYVNNLLSHLVVTYKRCKETAFLQQQNKHETCQAEASCKASVGSQATAKEFLKGFFEEKRKAIEVFNSRVQTLQVPPEILQAGIDLSGEITDDKRYVMYEDQNLSKNMRNQCISDAKPVFFVFGWKTRVYSVAGELMHRLDDCSKIKFTSSLPTPRKMVDFALYAYDPVTRWGCIRRKKDSKVFFFNQVDNDN